jgi:ABC-type uncharacterized transport system substrate-binding protein
VKLRLLVAGLLALCVPAVAEAHPHVWVDSASEVVFENGQITGIRHHWRFDEAFSAFAVQGLDTDKDGKLAREELQPLAQVNVDSLSEYGFFTQLETSGYEAGFADPQDYWLEQDGGHLILHFTLPLARPVAAKGEFTLQVFDPEYFVAFSLPNNEAVRMADAPAACTVAVNPARPVDASAAAMLATVGPEEQLPEEMKSLTEGLENSAVVTCR